MAVVVLAGLATFAAVSIGWRMWLQHRRTGDAGLRASPRTAREVFGGLLLVVGVAAAVASAVLDLAGAVEASEPLTHPLARAFGVACFLGGFALTVRAQVEMGESWRIGVDTAEATSLVTGGIFRHVRNPIYTGMILVFIGTALLVANGLAFAAATLVVAGLEVHVRFVEEPHLRATHGDRYDEYAASVGRFLPGIGRGARRR